jgi:hypothetical protein
MVKMTWPWVQKHCAVNVCHAHIYHCLSSTPYNNPQYSILSHMLLPVRSLHLPFCSHAHIWLPPQSLQCLLLCRRITYWRCLRNPCGTSFILPLSRTLGLAMSRPARALLLSRTPLLIHASYTFCHFAVYAYGTAAAVHGSSRTQRHRSGGCIISLR